MFCNTFDKLNSCQSVYKYNQYEIFILNLYLRMILNAPWFITNDNIYKDFGITKVKNEINKLSRKYIDRLSNHSNTLAITLLDESEEIVRLKRFHVLDLPFRK